MKFFVQQVISLESLANRYNYESRFSQPDHLQCPIERISDSQAGRQAHHGQVVGAPLERQIFVSGRHVLADATFGSGVSEPVLRRVST